MYALLLAVWQSLVVPHLPEITARVGTRMRDVIWVKPGIEPLPTEGDLTRARTIFAGDSRIWAGICLEYFDAAGLGPCAMIWGAEAKLPDILAAVLKFKPQRVVLGLSALGLKDSGMKMPRIFAENEFPNWRDDDFEEAYAAWHNLCLASLEKAGYTEKEYEYSLGLLEDLLFDARLVNSITPRGIDASLARWADDLRQRTVYTLQTSSWNNSWFVPIVPRKHDAIYEKILSAVPPDVVEKSLGQSLARVRELQARGIQVVVVRMPADAELMKIENSHVSPERFEQFCQDANVPYLDHSRDGFHTRDGVHLSLPGANHFSREFAGELAEIFDE